MRKVIACAILSSTVALLSAGEPINLNGITRGWV